MSPEDKSDIGKDYLDVSDEFESDIDNLDNDFEDGSDDGIFAPDQAKKKKTSLKITVSVLVLALLCGGGFYAYTNMNGMMGAGTISGQPANVPAIPQAANDTSADLPGVPKPASDFAEQPPVTPSENIPANLPEPEVAQDSNAQPVVLDQATDNSSLPKVPGSTADTVASVSEVGSGNTKTAPHITDKQITPELAPAVTGPESPAISKDTAPIPSEPPITNSEIPQPVTATPPAETSTPSVPVPPSEATAITPPDTSVLAAAPVTKAEETVSASEPVVAKKPIEKPKKEKEKKAADNFYFDAPKGKALTDIPPPSIDPMREPGQSIIIVHKRGEVVPKQRDENVVVKKSEDNDLIETRLVNANRAANLGMNDEALKFYNEVYRKNSSDPRILMGRAVALQKLGENQKAIDAYREVLDADPANEEATSNLMGLIGKTQPAVALNNLIDMHQKYPRNAMVSAQLGVAYAQSGNVEDGLKYLNMAAGQDVKNPQHFYNIAVIYDHMNNREKAIEYYEKALDTYSIYGEESKSSFSREKIYDRLASLRGN